MTTFCKLESLEQLAALSQDAVQACCRLTSATLQPNCWDPCSLPPSVSEQVVVRGRHCGRRRVMAEVLRCCCALLQRQDCACRALSCPVPPPAPQGILKLWRNICLVSQSVTCDEKGRPPPPSG